MTLPLQRTTVDIRINVILPETRVIGLTSLSLIVWVYLHSNFRDDLRKRMRFEAECVMAPSRSPKVFDFETDRKHVCDFLLVINSNLGPILPRLRDLAGFLLRTSTPPAFHPNFGVFPLDRLRMLWLRGAKTLSYYRYSCH